MKGEELQELNMEELMRLEKSLEGGLSRVVQTKVSDIIYFFFFLLLFNPSACLWKVGNI